MKIIHDQKVWKVSKIKNPGEYHDLNVQCEYIIAFRCF